MRGSLLARGYSSAEAGRYNVQAVNVGLKTHKKHNPGSIRGRGDDTIKDLTGYQVIENFGMV